MKQRLRNIITQLLVITTMITSCGYFESGGTSFQDSIVGNIKVQRQENSNETDLVLELSPDIFTVLTQSCDTVFYDEETNLIFSRSIDDGINPSYSEIKIDSIGQGIYKLSEKTALSESQFRRKTDCSAPYIDFENHRQVRAKEYYGNTYINQNPTMWTNENGR